METEPLPAFKLANCFARMTLKAYQQEIGVNGLNVLLNFAELYQMVDNLPLNNNEHEISFQHYSGILGALIAIYGVRTANNFSFRAGQRMYSNDLHRYGALGGLASSEFHRLMPDQRIDLSLHALIRVLNLLSNQNGVVRKRQGRWYIVVHNCPVCWGQSTEVAVCELTRGVISAVLEEAAIEIPCLVEQTQSHSAGDKACLFVISPKN